jgi:hypothetical protein
MNKKNYLTVDLIPKTGFQKILIGFLTLTALLIIYNGYNEFQKFPTVFDEFTIEEQQRVTYEIGYLQITKISDVSANGQKLTRFVTIMGLSYPATTNEQLREIGESSNRLMPGLISHPSFLVTGTNESFWKSQFYWLLFLYGAGPVIAGLLFVGFAVLMFKQKERLFTKEIKNGIHAFFWLIMGGFFLNGILFGRMIHFLNNNHGLGEKLTAGISNELITLATAILILIVFIERAIPIQEEQDLTV